MRLNAKVTLTLVLLIIASVALNYTAFYLFVYRSFEQLEQELARRDMGRCSGALAREQEYLAAFVTDWSQWDDTYRFIADRNAEYIRANLQFSSFKDNRLSLIRYYNEDGKLVWGRIVDLESGGDVALAGFAGGALARGSLLLQPREAGETRSGIVVTERGPMLIASGPILTSEGQGPRRGVVVMGRFLDESTVGSLGERLGVSLKVWPLSQGKVPSEEAGWLAAVPPLGSLSVAPRSERELLVYTTQADINGTPAILLRIAVPREVSARGRGAAWFGAMSMGVGGLLVLVAMLVFLWITVLRPVSQLMESVLEVRKADALTRPIALARRDEIGTLSREFEATMQEWAKARELANQASHAKTEFLSTIAHDMRTPLNGILGLAELIAASPLREASRSHARKIIGEAENLVNLINELLDTAKIEAGKLTVDAVPFDLESFMEEIGAIMGVRAMQKGLLYKQDLEPGLPRRVVGDPYRIRQVLINLIGNAVKFTEKGSVMVSAKVAEAQGENVRLRFTVKDTGVGIPTEKQSRVFQRYVQADAGTARKFGGTGLGTSIASELVELMGGEIGFESKEGEGSTFWFTLRLKTVATADQEKQAAWFLAPSGRILIVEDYVTSQQVASAHLQSAGYTVEVASTGEEALTKMKQSKFDLVLADVQLPDMSGIELTRRLRSGGAPYANIPILAATADATNEARRRCVEAGMNDVIIKPLRREVLLSAVSHVIRRQVGQQPLDWKRAVAEFGGDEGQVRALIGPFLEKAREQVSQMKSASAAGKLDAIRKEAHAMKGGAANLTADALAAAAQRIEEMLQAGKQGDLVKALDGLETEWNRLKSFAERMGLVPGKKEGGA